MKRKLKHSEGDSKVRPACLPETPSAQKAEPSVPLALAVAYEDEPPMRRAGLRRLLLATRRPNDAGRCAECQRRDDGQREGSLDLSKIFPESCQISAKFSKMVAT